MTIGPSQARTLLVATIRLNYERLKAAFIERSLETEHGTVIKLGDALDVIGSLQCSHGPCGNEARYSSGYCGIHDIEFNDGKGKRITHPE